MYVKLFSINVLVHMSVSFMWIKMVLTEAAQEESPSFHRILIIDGGAQPLVSSARETC